MIRTWKDNAFWDNEEHTRAKAILEIETEDGVKTSQVLTVNQFGPDGEENPDWTELMEAVGPDKITQETLDRVERKQKEQQQKEIREQEIKNAKTLEKLFNAKLEAFEIPEVKNSKNRALKSQLRRAKTIMQVNIYAMMIVMEAMNEESNEQQD